jgi:hypothetical protein
MSNLDRMPPGTRQPLVKPVDVDDVPILTISLSCATRDDLRAAPHRQRRARGPAARRGRVVERSCTAASRQINVYLDLERMRPTTSRCSTSGAWSRRPTSTSRPASLVGGNRVARAGRRHALRTADDVGDLVVALSCAPAGVPQAGRRIATARARSSACTASATARPIPAIAWPITRPRR